MKSEEVLSWRIYGVTQEQQSFERRVVLLFVSNAIIQLSYPALGRPHLTAHAGSLSPGSGRT